MNLSATGNTYDTDYIGSFAVISTSASGAAFIVLDSWNNSSADSTWSSTYYVYDQNGNAQDPDGLSPGTAWTDLLQNHFYRESMVFDEYTNQILSVSITDLTTNSTTDASPAGWYLFSSAGVPLTPNAFRFSGMGSTNGLLIDNVSLSEVPEPGTFWALVAGIVALATARRRHGGLRSCFETRAKCRIKR